MEQKNKRLKTIYFGNMRDLMGVLIAFLVIFVLSAFLSENFLTSQNLFNVLRQITVNIVLACGMTMVILIGGIDLSVGSIVAISACFCGGFITNNNIPVGIAIILAIICGLIFGIINGLIISFTTIPPFIVTLATMNIGRGIARIYTDNSTIMVQDSFFSFVGRGTVLGGIPIHILYILVVCIIAAVVLNRTKLGRYIYAIGDNEQAALYSGINVRKIKFLVYIIMAAFAACAGVMSAARTSSALFSVGDGYEMDAISAVVLGGTSMTGGSGRLGGTIIGAMLIGIINNIMNLMGIDSSWQYVVEGIVLVLAVYMDYLKKKRDKSRS